MHMDPTVSCNPMKIRRELTPNHKSSCQRLPGAFLNKNLNTVYMIQGLTKMRSTIINDWKDYGNNLWLILD